MEVSPYGSLRNLWAWSTRRTLQRLECNAKNRHLSDSNTRGQSPTAVLVAGDPVNHSGKVTSRHGSYEGNICRSLEGGLSKLKELRENIH